MKWTVVLLILLVLPTVVGISFMVEFLAVDAALDAGASYDYVTGRADPVHSHPFTSYFSRHRLLVILSTMSFLAALFFLTHLISQRLKAPTRCSCRKGAEH